VKQKAMPESERRDLSLLGRLRRLWKKYNPFDIDLAINKVLKTVDNIAVKVDSLHDIIDDDIKQLEAALEHKDHVYQQIVDSLPDMVWQKDMDGKYVVANKAIKEGLLLCSNPIGKTDIELAKQAKRIWGADNHTFGEMCADSDKITLANEEPSRFLESGRVKGEMLYLEVFKNVLRDSEGNIIGVCGSGRDMTSYVNAYRDSGDGDIFKEFEFGGINVK
jgi:PAS domain-containing protein